MRPRKYHTEEERKEAARRYCRECRARKRKRQEGIEKENNKLKKDIAKLKKVLEAVG